jgi:hypothetical protein
MRTAEPGRVTAEIGRAEQKSPAVPAGSRRLDLKLHE